MGQVPHLQLPHLGEHEIPNDFKAKKVIYSNFDRCRIYRRTITKSLFFDQWVSSTYIHFPKLLYSNKRTFG